MSSPTTTSEPKRRRTAAGAEPRRRRIAGAGAPLRAAPSPRHHGRGGTAGCDRRRWSSRAGRAVDGRRPRRCTDRRDGRRLRRLLGSADAPVLVEVYEDFMCPARGNFEAAAGAALREMTADGSVRVVFRPMAFLDWRLHCALLDAGVERFRLRRRRRAVPGVPRATLRRATRGGRALTLRRPAGQPLGGRRHHRPGLYRLCREPRLPALGLSQRPMPHPRPVSCRRRPSG